MVLLCSSSNAELGAGAPMETLGRTGVHAVERLTLIICVRVYVLVDARLKVECYCCVFLRGARGCPGTCCGVDRRLWAQHRLV